MFVTAIVTGAIAAAAFLIYAHRTYVEHVVSTELAKAHTEFVVIATKTKADVAKVLSDAKAFAAKAETSSTALYGKIEADLKKIF